MSIKVLHRIIGAYAQFYNALVIKTSFLVNKQRRRDVKPSANVIKSMLNEESCAITQKGSTNLGHVFNDGSKDEGGLRYCINSAALRYPFQRYEKRRL